MGRIAEALKKARQEREEQLRLGLGESPSVATMNDVPAGGEVSAAVTPPPVNRMAGVHVGSPQDGMAALRGLGGARSSRRPPAPVAPIALWNVHPSLVCANERWSSIAEQYRAIRTWLLRRNTTGDHTCLAVTSSVQREGKSVTTANLAVTMAEVRHMNVLAVDCDFRGCSLAKLFQVPNAPGLADVLAGRVTLAEAIAKTPLGNLSILPAGLTADHNPTELLNSPMAARVFDEIRERHHYVLVDTPPVQRLSDVGVIGALCSGILMVVRMHKTPSNLVRQSLHWLQSNNLNVVGCIAAACSAEDARHLYREDYKSDEH